MGSYTASLGLIAALGFFSFLIGIAVYILEAAAFYKAFKKAGIQNAWLAWIPIAQLWPWMKVIKKSAWNILWLLCPIANIVFGIIWQGRYLKAFGLSRLWLLGWIGCIIPGLNYLVGILWIVLYCVIGFSSRPYNPNFDVVGSQTGMSV